MSNRKVWNVELSKFAKNTNNPQRKFLEKMRSEHNPDIPVISLGLGDSTVLSDIAKPETFKVALAECIKEKSCDSYQPSFGSEAARAAVAKYSSRPHHVVYKPSDIIVANGGNETIDFCITALADYGQNILIPKPGFVIYKVFESNPKYVIQYKNLEDTFYYSSYLIIRFLALLVKINS